ncbi:MAG: DUF4097 family beta strand repeat-containing protein [Clostridiaceae bacterium]
MSGFKKVIAVTLIIASVAIGVGAYILYESGFNVGDLRTNMNNFFRGNDFSLNLGNAVPVSEDREFSLGNKKDIVIETSIGELIITENDGDVITMSVDGDIPTKYEKNYLKVTDTDEELKLFVLDELSNVGDFGLHNYNLTVKISIPKKFAGNLDISTVSGENSVTGLELSSLDVSSISGDITLQDGKYGELKFYNVSGNVFAYSEAGKAQGESVSGNLTLSSVNEGINLKTVSGNIKATVAALKGKATADSISGEIEIELLDSIETSYKLNTVSGKLTVDDGGNVQTGEKSITKTVSGTDRLIDASTVSGNIKIKY